VQLVVSFVSSPSSRVTHLVPTYPGYALHTQTHSRFAKLHWDQVYLQYGVQVVTRQFGSSTNESAFVSIILAILSLVTAHLLLSLSRTLLFHRMVRTDHEHGLHQVSDQGSVGLAVFF